MSGLAGRRTAMQRVAQEVWKELFEEECPEVYSIGSNEYDLATSTSDVDFAMPIPDIHERQAQVFRAKLRVHLIQRCNVNRLLHCSGNEVGLRGAMAVGGSPSVGSGRKGNGKSGYALEGICQPI